MAHLQHFGLGMEVRNTLREAGFRWAAVALDENWVALFMEASRRTLGNASAMPPTQDTVRRGE